MGSPYPISYNLRWPYLNLRPSIQRHTDLPRAPLADTLMPEYGGRTVRAVFFGDLMHMPFERVPACDPAVRVIFEQADLIVGNCESPVTRKARNRRALYLLNFKMSSDFIGETMDVFGMAHDRVVLSVANNHMADQWLSGAVETLDRLRALGITPVGQAEGESSPVITRTIEGVKFGFAAWTHWLNHERFPLGEGVWRTADAEIADWKGMRKDAEIDTMVALPHWEWEFQHYPRPDTVAFARKLLAGAFDMLVGHHPHVLQPLERIDGRLCQYSIGNLFGTPLGWPTKLVGLLEVEFAAVEPYRGRIVRYCMHPCVQDSSGRRQRIVPLAYAPAGRREKMEQRLDLLFAPPSD